MITTNDHRACLAYVAHEHNKSDERIRSTPVTQVLTMRKRTELRLTPNDDFLRELAQRQANWHHLPDENHLRIVLEAI